MSPAWARASLVVRPQGAPAPAYRALFGQATLGRLAVFPVLVARPVIFGSGVGRGFRRTRWQGQGASLPSPKSARKSGIGGFRRLRVPMRIRDRTSVPAKRCDVARTVASQSKDDQIQSNFRTGRLGNLDLLITLGSYGLLWGLQLSWNSWHVGPSTVELRPQAPTSKPLAQRCASGREETGGQGEKVSRLPLAIWPGDDPTVDTWGHPLVTFAWQKQPI